MNDKFVQPNSSSSVVSASSDESTKQKLSREVRQGFDNCKLPPDLNHYSLTKDILTNKQVVTIDGPHSPCKVFCDPDTNHLICNSDQCQLHGMCDYQRALLGGLWSRLTIARTRSLVARTQDWRVQLPTVRPVASSTKSIQTTAAQV